MKLAIKIMIGINDLWMIMMLFLSLEIYFSPPGLHYLVIAYSALCILILTTIRLIVLKMNGRKSLIDYFPFLTFFFITVNLFFETENNVIPIILASISCLLMLFVAYDFWKPQNIGHSLVDKTIKYFSVDLESKGWIEKKK
jgi:hypothetical protein